MDYFAVFEPTEKLKSGYIVCAQTIRRAEIDMLDPEVLLRGLLAAGDAGDLAAFDMYLHEDVIVHAPAGLSTVGLDNERESWSKAKLAIPDLHHEIRDVLSSPTLVAARAVVTGTMRGSYGGLSAEGRSFGADQAVFARVRDGKIAELWEIVDMAVLREQLGGSHR